MNSPEKASTVSPAGLPRREFITRLAATAAGALVVTGGSSSVRAATPAAGDPSKSVRRGIWQTAEAPRPLISPVSTPAGETWRYLIPYPFQVAPRLAALSLNIKPYPGVGQDFPCGVDILLFDDLRDLHPERAIPLTRNHDEPNPNADGKMAHMGKTPAQVGFVPWGARRADGSPHPHAGTGFAISNASARPVDDSEGTVNFPDRIGRSAFRGVRAYDYIERFQLSYDGQEFKVGERERLKTPEVRDGFEVTGRGLSTAIPDGDDLLLPMQGRDHTVAKYGSGVARWRRRDGHWQPVAFVMITPEDNSLEPTLVRDVDGGLLFLGRGRRDAGPPVRIWRQAPGATDWKLIVNQKGLTNSTPITINSAVDGTPYVLMNLHQPEFHLPPEIPSDGGISRLEPKGWRGERSAVCLWALNANRDGFDTPLLLKDPLVEYGVPPRGTIWAADHTNATVVQLGDGQWHSIYGHRLLEWIENTHFTPPCERTGCYLGEVVSLGPPIAPWRF